ncbi:hypothetical protein AB0J91_25665, partial [Saccharopolyspora sp. NPDC049357]
MVEIVPGDVVELGHQRHHLTCLPGHCGSRESSARGIQDIGSFPGSSVLVHVHVLRDRPACMSDVASDGAGREHGLLDALERAGVRVIADSAYRGAGVNVEV